MFFNFTYMKKFSTLLFLLCTFCSSEFSEAINDKKNIISIRIKDNRGKSTLAIKKKSKSKMSAKQKLARKKKRIAKKKRMKKKIAAARKMHKSAALKAKRKQRRAALRKKRRQRIDARILLAKANSNPSATMQTPINNLETKLPIQEFLKNMNVLNKIASDKNNQSVHNVDMPANNLASSISNLFDKIGVNSDGNTYTDQLFQQDLNSFNWNHNAKEIKDLLEQNWKNINIDMTNPTNHSEYTQVKGMVRGIFGFINKMIEDFPSLKQHQNLFFNAGEGNSLFGFTMLAKLAEMTEERAAQKNWLCGPGYLNRFLIGLNTSGEEKGGLGLLAYYAAYTQQKNQDQSNIAGTQDMLHALKDLTNNNNIKFNDIFALKGNKNGEYSIEYSGPK